MDADAVLRRRQPLPAMVNRPSTKSVGASGIGSGSQRNWFGVRRRVVEISCGNADCSQRLRTVPCIAAGRMRYSQLRRFSRARRGERGARQLLGVQAVRDRCGELRPSGSVPAHGFGGELVAEAGMVAVAVEVSLAVSVAQRDNLSLTACHLTKARRASSGRARCSRTAPGNCPRRSPRCPCAG